MNVLKVLSFITVMLISTGCYKTIVTKQTDRKISLEQLAELRNACAEINEQGDMLKLLKEIKRNTNEVIKILESGEIQSKEARIGVLTEKVERQSKQVVSLSKTEWTNVDKEFELRWKINESHFNDLIGTRVRNGFQIKAVEIQEVYFMAEKRPDIKQQLVLKVDDNQIKVSLSSTGSALELCQLQKTMMILMKVDYRNITNRNERFFNLTVGMDL